MSTIFDSLSGWLAASPLLALGAAALWGVAAVLLSGCHLSGIPIAMGYLELTAPTHGARRVLRAFLLGLGLLLALGVAAGLTLWAGRMLGDLWGLGPYLSVALLLLAGLLLLDVIPGLSGLPGLNLGRLPLPQGTGPRSVAVGGLLGLTLGPCTFGFLAPVLGVVLGASAASASVPAPNAALQIPSTLLLVAAFALGHLLAIVLLGSVGASLVVCLAGQARLGQRLRKSAGVLLIVAGLVQLVLVP